MRPFVLVWLLCVCLVLRDFISPRSSCVVKYTLFVWLQGLENHDAAVFKLQLGFWYHNKSLAFKYFSPCYCSVNHLHHTIVGNYLILEISERGFNHIWECYSMPLIRYPITIRPCTNIHGHHYFTEHNSTSLINYYKIMPRLLLFILKNQLFL